MFETRSVTHDGDQAVELVWNPENLTYETVDGEPHECATTTTDVTYVLPPEIAAMFAAYYGGTR